MLSISNIKPMVTAIIAGLIIFLNTNGSETLLAPPDLFCPNPVDSPIPNVQTRISSSIAKSDSAVETSFYLIRDLH